MTTKAKKDGGVDAPISLGDIFSINSDNEEEERFQNEFENQTLSLGIIILGVEHLPILLLSLGDRSLIIRQSSWHQTNANKVGYYCY